MANDGVKEVREVTRSQKSNFYLESSRSHKNVLGYGLDPLRLKNVYLALVLRTDCREKEWSLVALRGGPNSYSGTSDDGS